ncbi:hypothetical protein [Streptacidiphilus fuscans]|uniref:Uncharacterized protein n=1 Tax=Streptacidiphilus fuscans TaxID=2789292 RepID=A0A931FB30_9ACTN|nr:hypothetical protein [Streptacidiphilus fuscans]MBF9068252.1 hypothetical protein [Streptacidiphilus fuscans]
MPVAASVVGLAVAAVLALGTPLAWAHEAGPGSASSVVTLRLPDGRPLHFVRVRSARTPARTAGRTPAHRPSHAPGHRPPGGVASGPPVGSAPGGPPSADPSVTALPFPVVSSLFPSPPASGKPSSPSGASTKPRPGTPSGRPSAEGTPSRTPGEGGGSRGGSPAPQAVSVPVGQDAVQPIDQQPRPAASVPPPLGPQAVLPPDSLQQAAPRTRLAARDTGLDLGPHARLLGVGLALIGIGAALFGWRIRRL